MFCDCGLGGLGSDKLAEGVAWKLRRGISRERHCDDEKTGLCLDWNWRAAGVAATWRRPRRRAEEESTARGVRESMAGGKVRCGVLEEKKKKREDLGVRSREEKEEELAANEARSRRTRSTAEVGESERASHHPLSRFSARPAASAPPLLCSPRAPGRCWPAVSCLFLVYHITSVFYCHHRGRTSHLFHVIHLQPELPRSFSTEF